MLQSILFVYKHCFVALNVYKLVLTFQRTSYNKTNWNSSYHRMWRISTHFIFSRYTTISHRFQNDICVQCWICFIILSIKQKLYSILWSNNYQSLMRITNSKRKIGTNERYFDYRVNFAHKISLNLPVYYFSFVA